MEGKTAFPSRQLFVLAICRICEPIAFMSIFPYIYYMVQWFGVARNEREIALYTGMVTSAFALAEFATGVLWGRLSDRIGRKPVLLCGLAGTSISMLVFGLSKSLPMALVARALGGLLNGNIGVIQTTVAEAITVQAHQARAYSIMPFIWCLGSIVGAGLGGTLADPVHSYPAVFDRFSLFAEYPYLLPNLVCAGVCVFSLTVGILFLEETHEDKKYRRDPGLAMGQWLTRRRRGRSLEEKEALMTNDAYFDETLSLLSDEESLPGYESTVVSPRISTSALETPSPDIESLDGITLDSEKNITRQAFTPQVLINIIGLGILAFHTITFEQLLPILLSMPSSTEPASLPLHFTGGLSLSTKAVGSLLSLQGIIQMVMQIFAFPLISNRVGPLNTFRIVAFGYPLLYFLTPYLALLPDGCRMPAIYVMLFLKTTAQALSYPSQAIMLANMAPKRMLGLLNGVAASAASGARAVGPTLSGMLQTAGLQIHMLVLPWWVSGLVAVAGAVLSVFARAEIAPTTARSGR